MPLLDGIEATRQIRALRNGKQVKIAALTASTFKEENKELIAAGFDVILHKPFRSQQICKCMQNLLDAQFVDSQTPVTQIETQLKTDVESELNPTVLASLPLALPQNLASAIATLNRNQILNAVTQIEKIAPNLAAALKIQVDNFDYATISRLVQSGLAKCLENKEQL